MTRRMTLLMLGALAASTAMFTSAWAQDTYKPGCYAPAPNSASVISYPKKAGPYKIALVNGYVGNDWRANSIQTAKAWGARPEIKSKLSELKIVSVGNDSTAQISAIDNFIAAGYDAVIINAVNPTAFDAVVRRAKQAGVVLVTYDNVLDSDQVVQINEDQVDLGRIKAQAVVDGIKAKKGNVSGQVLEIDGVPGNSVDRDNQAGFSEVFSKYPELKVVKVEGDWDVGTASKVTSDAIATNGNFDGIVVQEGSVGALEAMAAAKHPVVPVGFDAGNGTRMLVNKGKYPGITAAQAPALAAMALEASVVLLEGNALPQKVFLPIPQKNNADLAEGKDFFPDLPKTFYTATGFPQCFPVFTPDELKGQTADNAN